MSDIETPASTNQGEPGPVVTPDPHEAGNTHGHPTEATYIKVAVVLCLITALEVLVYTINSLGDILPFVLVTASAVKFTLVVLFFMHLRFDSRLFRRLFFTGMILAVFVYGVALTTLHAWSQK